MAIDKHPTPLNEQDRLEALKALKILDSARAENFDYITAAVAKHYDVPIALVSLVDSERQWFKSKLGLDAEQTARDISFCTYAIMEPRHLLVHDATEDERFCNNPLVISDPKIRFYAGVPLFLCDGIALGTLCIIDRKPRRDITDLTKLTLLAEKTIEAIVDHYDQLTNTDTENTRDKPTFRHQGKKTGEVTTFFLYGELTRHHAHGFYRQILAQTDSQATKEVVLDLSQCSYIDQQGFNALAQLYHQCIASNINCRCVEAAQDIAYLFECMGAKELLQNTELTQVKQLRQG